MLEFLLKNESSPDVLVNANNVDNLSNEELIGSGYPRPRLSFSFTI